MEGQLTHVILFLPLQQKQQEMERVQKWLKMVQKWDKYRNSERVSKPA